MVDVRALVRQSVTAWLLSCAAGTIWAAALAGVAHAQGQDDCTYADQNYSHGAIYAGTRCNNGTWINLSVAEFRRLYPNGLGGGGVAPTGEDSGAGPDRAASPPAPATAPAQ